MAIPELDFPNISMIRLNRLKLRQSNHFAGGGKTSVYIIYKGDKNSSSIVRTWSLEI